MEAVTARPRSPMRPATPEFDGKKIKEGEYLALCEGKLCANSRKPFDAVKKLAREMVRTDSAFATIIFGEGVSEEDAAKVEEIFRKENRDLEITVIDGGSRFITISFQSNKRIPARESPAPTLYGGIL